MKNFKNSKTAKFVSGFVGLSMAAMMLPGVASAATVEELTAQINALLAQVSALQATTGNSTATPAACAYTFAQTLKVGVSSDEVTNLQKVLNMSADTQVSATGVGSKGMETKYFGAMTKAAVIKFQEKYAADILTPNGLTKGTGLVGAATRAKLNAMCTTTTTPTTPTTTGSTTVSGSVSATLDTMSPAAGSVIKGASTKVAIFKLTNNGSAAAKVTSVKMKRTGVSSDSTLNNVYLYNGDSRLTDAASVATGLINFSDTAGIVTIPANSSIALGVMVEVSNASTVNNGETIGVMLTDVTVDGVAVAGLPISGAQQTVVGQPDGMATVSFNGTTLPSSSSNVDPQADYVVWQNTVNVQSRDALMSSIRFRQLGSVSTSDLKNFRLMVDGTQVGAAVDSVNSNQYVEFTFATPVTMKAGGRTVKLVADIVGGSNKTFAFSVQQAVDAMFTDSQLNVVVAPKVGINPFSAVTSATQTVNQGTLTITKATDSLSGNVVLQGTGLTLAKFNVKAAGEKLKIENLKVQFTYSSSTGSLAKIRNGAIFANGVQIGSTAGITEDSAATPYTQFNLGSSLIVEPGHDVVIEIRGDIANGGSNGEFAAGETLIAKIAAGTSNVYKMSSYGYIGNSAVAGNTLTIASGSMTVAKATSYASQTVVVPQTALKIAEFNVTTGSTEALNLNQFTLSFGGSGYNASQLQDVYITYGSKQTTVKATVASTSNTFSINENVAANTTMSVKVYATLNAGIATSAIITPSIVVDATSQASGNAATGSATGQSMTVNTGSLSVATDASTPVSALVVGGTMPIVGAYKFTASNDSFTVVDLSIEASSTASIVELVFKDGTTELGRQPFNGNYATKTGLNLLVPANQNKVVTVYAQLGSIGTNAAASGQSIQLALTSVKYRDSNGVETTDPLFTQSNAMYVFKTKPTITNVALPTSILNAGTQTVAQFTVTADAAGTIAWRQIKLNVATTTVTAASFNIYDSANQSTPLANVTPNVNPIAGVVTFTSSQDQEVSGSKTYVVKATIGGSVTTGAAISVNIPSLTSSMVAPAASNAGALSGASFIWSDEAITPHTGLTADWVSDYLVKNLPTDSQTLTK